MDEKQLQEIERKNEASLAHGEFWEYGPIEIGYTDVRALIAEVRRLRKYISDYEGEDVDVLAHPNS